MRTKEEKKMLEFKKYSSIENSFSREFMEHVVAEMPQDLEYDELEDFLKEHGNLYAALVKNEQKLLNKELNKFCSTLVKQAYMSHTYIIE